MLSEPPVRRRPVRSVRQREIAAQAGVSVSTVSRVLNGVNGISPKLQERVLAAAAELGHAGLSHTHRAAVHQVGLFVNQRIDSQRIANNGDQFHGDILAGVEAECRRRDVQLSYAVVEDRPDAADFVLDRVRRHQIDALLFVAIDDGNVVERVLALGLPVALLNAEHPQLPVDAFVPDNEGGPRLAVAHLAAHGHRRVLHLTQRGRAGLRRRHAAFRAAFADYGFDDDPDLVLESSLNEHQDYLTMRRVLERGLPDVTAVCCVNDLSALGTIRALHEVGIRVPDEVSVIGFDDLSFAAVVAPPLTTVRVERQAIGAAATRRLFERAAEPTLVPVRVALACRLIERGSVAAAPPGAAGG
jgi:DNA-binding LacI/PurR family transcriptional regulator